MASKIITCPQCNGRLEVDNPHDEPVLMIKCANPNCGATLRVRFDTGRTVLAPSKLRATVPGFLTLNGQRYPLAAGRNIVGRASSSGTADIALDTADKTMSRRHCLIEALSLDDGTVKAVISDLRDADKMAAKPILLNDEPLLDGERIVLDSGDEITLGDTTLRFTQQEL